MASASAGTIWLFPRRRPCARCGIRSARGKRRGNFRVCRRSAASLVLFSLQPFRGHHSRCARCAKQVKLPLPFHSAVILICWTPCAASVTLASCCPSNWSGPVATIPSKARSGSNAHNAFVADTSLPATLLLQYRLRSVAPIVTASTQASNAGAARG